MLVLIQLLVLVPEWHLWHSGAAEVYVGQHRKLVFGSLSGILLALALPLQAFLTHSKKLSVGHRRTCCRPRLFSVPSLSCRCDRQVHMMCVALVKGASVARCPRVSGLARG